MANKISNLSGMPQMYYAFQGWQVSFTLVKVAQSNVDGENVETKQSFKYKGTVQPLSPEAIQLKPEGERSWEWLQVHVITDKDANLKVGDQVVYDGKPYKVMFVKNYKLNNYVEYHLLQDYV